MTKKFYTAFAVSGHPVKDLHCTHKYLGPLGEKDLEAVCLLVGGALRSASRFTVVFSEVAYFGKEGDVRVLTPRSPSFGEIYHDLRLSLDHYRKDDFAGWSPHVTTEAPAPLVLTFDRYVICEKETVVAEWKLS